MKLLLLNTMVQEKERQIWKRSIYFFHKSELMQGQKEVLRGQYFRKDHGEIRKRELVGINKPFDLDELLYWLNELVV